MFGCRVPGWFDWKYESNPYIDHVPMIVATHDGEVVGAKPCFAMQLTAGTERVLGLQPADVMVHADHRRRGLYSRTTEELKRRYQNSTADLFFNYPNTATLQGSLKHGWSVVETVPTYYRIHDPTEFLANTRFAALAPFIRAGTRMQLGIRDRMRPRKQRITVQRFEKIPIPSLLELYERAPPAGFHATRDETFYRWRFDNPRWTYHAYVARRKDELLAGIITGTGMDGTTRLIRVVDIVPLKQSRGRQDGLRAILDRLIEDARGADLVAISGQVIPPSLLREFGFVSDQQLPLRLVGQPTVQVAYPLRSQRGHPWTVAGMAVADAANWCVTFSEQDSR
ncbi:MAG: GNAT family N-acetyltransferase [Natrialbaceae archaeon]|nr:GNAT family N-acetyltransferase [Natrialbaceae archaeon]